MIIKTDIFHFPKGSCPRFNPSSHQSLNVLRTQMPTGKLRTHRVLVDILAWQLKYLYDSLVEVLFRLSTGFVLLLKIKGFLGYKIQKLADTSASFVFILGNEVLQHAVVFAPDRIQL